MAIVAGVACQCRAPSSPIPDGGYGLNPGDVLQFHKNPTRDGFYSDPAFTKAAIPNMHVDTGFDGTTAGQTFSQPLFMLDGAGGRATLFIATETDQVFALDAATGANLWTANLGTPAPKGEFCGGSIDPLGITGTPVIDPVSRTMFLDAMLNAGSNGRTPRQTVFALSVDDGSVRWKLDLSSAVSGFDSTIQNQRGALTLMDGIVYIPFGGLDGDCGPYRGWVIGVPAQNPAAATGWSTAAPSGPGIWGPSGVASDGTSLYVATGNTNSPYPTPWSAANSEAVMKLFPGPTFLDATENYFAGMDWHNQDTSDADLGSSGVVLFDAPAATPGHLAFAIGKTTNAYLLDRDNLGGINDGLSTPLLASSGQIFGSLFAYATTQGAYFGLQGTMLGCSGGDVSVLKVSSASPPKLSVAWCANGGGAGSPIASTSGNLQDVVVWTYGAAGDELLRAYDGDTGGTPLYRSPALRGSSHWISPIVGNGRIYVAGNGVVTALTVP